MLFSWHSSLLNGQAKFYQGKYVIWHTCPADKLEKQTKWIPAFVKYETLLQLTEFEALFETIQSKRNNIIKSLTSEVQSTMSDTLKVRVLVLHAYTSPPNFYFHLYVFHK